MPIHKQWLLISINHSHFSLCERWEQFEDEPCGSHSSVAGQPQPRPSRDPHPQPTRRRYAATGPPRHLLQQWASLFLFRSLSIPIWFDSSVSLFLLLLRLFPLKLSFSFLCFVFSFCMINNEFDNVPLVKFNCLSQNTLHSPHDWPCSSWKCIACLSLLANIRGQRLSYCPLSRPTVCEYNTHINTHMPNTIAENA